MDSSISLPPILILCVGASVSVVGLLESWSRWPYAPFLLIHAFLALLIPFKFGSINLHEPLQQLRCHRKALVMTSVALLSFMGSFILIYSAFLILLGKDGEPNWDLLAQYRLLQELYVSRYGRTVVFLMGYLLVGVWPAFGEEFFYRGFLFGGLKRYMPVPVAAVLSSTFFGLRHSFQLVYLWPSYPWVAGTAYFLWAFGFATVWAWSYHRTGSIMPCMLTHAANLALAPVVFVILIS